jgi:hypothetical protein
MPPTSAKQIWIGNGRAKIRRKASLGMFAKRLVEEFPPLHLLELRRRRKRLKRRLRLASNCQGWPGAAE